MNLVRNVMDELLAGLVTVVTGYFHKACRFGHESMKD